VTGLQAMESFADLRLGHCVVHRVVSSGHTRHTSISLHRIERRLELVEVRHVVRTSGAREHRAPRNALPAQTATTCVRQPSIQLRFPLRGHTRTMRLATARIPRIVQCSLLCCSSLYNSAVPRR
jgi:hypothetical protein